MNAQKALIEQQKDSIETLKDQLESQKEALDAQYVQAEASGDQALMDSLKGQIDSLKEQISVINASLHLTAKDKKQKELRRQYCLDGGAVVKPREVLRQFYEENYIHQEQFRSAWETLNKAEKKSWADRHAYEQAKSDYLSWLDSRLSYAKRIHIDQDGYLEES